jgi:hypothetical protein
MRVALFLTSNCSRRSSRRRIQRQYSPPLKGPPIGKKSQNASQRCIFRVQLRFVVMQCQLATHSLSQSVNPKFGNSLPEDPRTVARRGCDSRTSTPRRRTRHLAVLPCVLSPPRTTSQPPFARIDVALRGVLWSPRSPWLTSCRMRGGHLPPSPPPSPPITRRNQCPVRAARRRRVGGGGRRHSARYCWSVSCSPWRDADSLQMLRGRARPHQPILQRPESQQRSSIRTLPSRTLIRGRSRKRGTVH